jgi:hypothetical protein
VRLDSLNPRVVVFDLRAGSLCPRAETLSHLVSGPYLDILVVCGPGKSFYEWPKRRHSCWLKFEHHVFWKCRVLMEDPDRLRNLSSEPEHSDLCRPF